MKNRTPKLTSDDAFDLRVLLRPSGALLRAQIMLTTAFDLHVVSETNQHVTTLDLLIRIRLSDDGQLRAVDLCDQLQKSPSHVSRVIDSAEADGLVSRLPDPSDRRAHLVILTDEGVEVVDELAPHVAMVLHQSIFSALSPEEIETLIELLERITISTRRLLSDN